MSETLVSIRPSPVHAARWAAVLAGMAVGIAFHLVLALAGAAAGLSLHESGRPIEPIPLAAAAWNLGAMLVAALIGGYVAARASGLRRLADGVLHGTVAWGATTVLLAALASSALGTMIGGLFGPVAPQARAVEAPNAAGSPFAQSVVDALRSDDHARAVRRLQDQFRVGEEEANRYLDLAGALTGRTPVATGDRIERTAATAEASAWLAAAIALSLLAAMIGGGIGARGARRLLKGRRFEVADTRPGGFAEPAH